MRSFYIPFLSRAGKEPLLPGFLTLLALLLASTAVAQNAPARPEVRRTILANGLRLLCKQNDSSDIVAIVAQIRAGLPDEPEEKLGVAALTAEALLRGTTTHSGQSFGQQVVEAGGNLSAESGFDFTEIAAVTDRGRWERALKLVAGVIADPALEPAGVEDARDVVRRKIAGFERDFTGGNYQRLAGLLYAAGPYGRPIYGTPASLSRVTPGDVRRFWERHYVQNRITIAIVGDVDPPQAIRAAEKAFAQVPFRESPPVELARDTLERPKVDLVQRPGPGGMLMVGYLAPPVTAAGYPVYSVLEALLGGGKRSRLSIGIRDEGRLGYILGATYQPLLGQSHLLAYLVFPVPPTDVASPQIDRPKTLLLQQLRELAEKGPTDAELQRARAFAIGHHALRHERNRDQAKWISWAEAAGLGVAVDQEFAARAAAVTKEQIHQAAKDVFKNYALVVSVPPPGQ